MLLPMQRRQLNLSLDLELLDRELHGRCHDGNGGDYRFSGWLGLIGRRFPPTKRGTQC
jgi:hypothetical protein